MSRDDGFAIADIDSAMLEDGKLKSLWQALRDEERMTHAVTLYVAVLLSSWRHGRRVRLAEALPTWLTSDTELVAALRRVHLLDGSERICLRAWHGWFDPAYERREERRERGRRGGKASGEVRRSTSSAQVKRKSSTSEPDRPTGRSVVASSKHPSRGRGREEGAAPTHSEASETLTAVRRRLEGNGTLRVVDRDELLAEPMPAEVSATVRVEEPA